MFLYVNLFLASFFISTLIFIIIRSSFFENSSQLRSSSTSRLINIPSLGIKLIIVIFTLFSFIFYSLDLTVVYCTPLTVDNDTLSISENTMSGNINVTDPNIHIPSSVTQGLTSLVLGASIASGASSEAAVVKKLSIPLGAKIGAFAAGGVIGGLTYLGLSATNSIIQKNITKTTEAVSTLKEGTDSLSLRAPALSSTPKCYATRANANKGRDSASLANDSLSGVGVGIYTSSGGSVPPSVASVFKINSPLEPHDISDSFTAQTVMDLMNSTLILNSVIVYLLLLLIMFIIGKLVISNQLDLNWIKRLPFGDKTYFYLMILLKMWGKSSLFFIFFIWIMLLFASMFSTYFIYVLITNFDSISEVYQSTKDVLPKK